MSATALRNKAIRITREFFAERKILEVMTPKAVHSPALEPYIDPVALTASQSAEQLFLTTSPEFALKKIFADELRNNAGALGIYEIAPVFRDDRPGKNHAIEFTMIEWYMKDSSLTEILEMSAALIQTLSSRLGSAIAPESIAIRDLAELFSQGNCKFDFADAESVIAKYQALHGTLPQHFNRIDAAIACFNLLFDEFVLPQIRELPCLIALRGYPEYLAALAFSENGIAERAEIFYHGLELANGYREEFRPEIARKRWVDYNEIRKARKTLPHAIDEALLTALPNMAHVSGIAVGIERVLMSLFPGLDIPQFYEAGPASNFLP